MHRYGALANRSTGLQTGMYGDTGTYLTAHRDATFMGDVNMPYGQALSLHVTMRHPRVQNQLLLAGPLHRTRAPSVTNYHGLLKRQIPRRSRSALDLKARPPPARADRRSRRARLQHGPLLQGETRDRGQCGWRAITCASLPSIVNHGCSAMSLISKGWCEVQIL